MAEAQSPADGVTKWTPPSTDPRDFEGVWVPAGGGPPPTGKESSKLGVVPVKAATADKATGPAGLLPQGAVTGRVNAPPETGGLDQPPVGGGGAAANSNSGSTLQCTPTDRLGGAGGGMSNLWLQSDDEIAMISEEDQDVARKIYMNMKVHPKDLTPQPNGHSIGRWDGNTLVVDTVGFGTPDGKLRDLHRIERFHKSGNYLIDDITSIENGKRTHQTNRELWRSDYHVFENVCEEDYDRYSVVAGSVVNSNIPPSDEK